jgi:hypothetical protein
LTGRRKDTVNIMTFDYYLASEPKPLNMGAEATTAARNVHRQLAALYPGYSQQRLWHMEGITILPGPSAICSSRSPASAGTRPR